MSCTARRMRLFEGKNIDAFLIFVLDRMIPSQMDRPNVQCLSGYGGVRIEDTVLVTETGCELMTSFPKESLIEVGGSRRA